MFKFKDLHSFSLYTEIHFCFNVVQDMDIWNYTSFYNPRHLILTFTFN